MKFSEKSWYNLNMKTLTKFNRLSAWILLFGIALYFLTGYGMTKEIIDPVLASKLHLHQWLSIVIIIAFTIHGAFASRLSLICCQKWTPFYQFLWGIFFTVFFFGFIYIGLIYQQPTQNTETSNTLSETTVNNTNTTSSNQNSQTATTSTTTTEDTSETTVFSKSDLAKYDGQDGQPSYVAVNGVVYDVSSLFVNGVHRGCYAGQDVSSEFTNEHSSSYLSGFPVVGTYKP